MNDFTPVEALLMVAAAIAIVILAVVVILGTIAVVCAPFVAVGYFALEICKLLFA